MEKADRKLDICRLLMCIMALRRGAEGRLHDQTETRLQKLDFKPSSWFLVKSGLA